MKNASKKNGFTFFSLFFALVLAAQTGSGISVPEVADLTCQSPSVSVTGKSGSSISFSWGSCTNTGYRVYYTRQEDNYTSIPVTTGNTTITFSDLPPGTYNFHFCTICIDSESAYTVIEDLMMG